MLCKVRQTIQTRARSSTSKHSLWGGFNTSPSSVPVNFVLMILLWYFRGFMYPTPDPTNSGKIKKAFSWALHHTGQKSSHQHFFELTPSCPTYLYTHHNPIQINPYDCCSPQKQWKPKEVDCVCKLSWFCYKPSRNPRLAWHEERLWFPKWQSSLRAARVSLKRGRGAVVGVWKHPVIADGSKPKPRCCKEVVPRRGISSRVIASAALKGRKTLTELFRI